MDFMSGNPNKSPQQIEVPQLYEKPFEPSKIEKIAMLLSYPVALLYTYILLPSYSDGSRYVITAVFTALFCASVELFYHKQKATRESFIWLGSIAVILASMLLGRNQVWGDGLAIFFIHCYAVYWLMSRSGRLMDKVSGPFAPLDIINGYFVFPFKHFFLRIKVLWMTVTSGMKKRENRESKIGAWVAVAVGIVLFCIAGSLLASADETFNRIIGNLLKYFDIKLFSEIIIRFIVSIPVGAYLYGLIIGTGREDTSALRKKKDLILQRINQLRKVPVKVWTFIMTGFCAMYLLFFFIQGSYLFGAFTRTLPEGFTVAQYARQGFFELCKIMALNFLLLWIVIKSSKEDIRNNRIGMVMCSIILIESILFSVTAFSKLILYISCFGFTPRRIQSSWLVFVLFCGSVLAVYSLWTRKKSFRIWVFISGISLALTHLY
ncbi:MAG: DUF4173 domain-containing protein [Clostridiaceae bacterium]|nr:DUF4173 domain-containing protein [Clostridiaceae bacterium]